MNLNYCIEFPEIDLDKEIPPLISACYYGNIDIVKLILLNRSIDIDISTPVIGYTALTIAVLKADYELLNILISHDPEVNKPLKNSETPLSLCF